MIDGGHGHCQASNSQNNAAKAFIEKFLFGDNSQNTKIRSSNVNPTYSSGKYDWGGHKIVNNGCGGSASGVENVLMEGYSLSQNMPNPTSDETSIEFSIADNTFVSITLYNELGMKVMDIVSDDFSAGSYKADFSVDGLASGIYHYVMQANGFVSSKSLIVK